MAIHDYVYSIGQRRARMKVDLWSQTNLGFESCIAVLFSNCLDFDMPPIPRSLSTSRSSDPLLIKLFCGLNELVDHSLITW